LRTFLAVPLPGALQRQLQDEITRLRPLLPKVRWVRPGSMHLTLLFLGEVDPDQVPRLAQLVGSACRQVTAASVPVRGLGWFPERGPVRVLWVGLDDTDGVLGRLRGLLDGCTRQLDLPGADGTFQPHLTLGRARARLRRGEVRAILEQEAVEFEDLPVEECILFRSTLGAGGARHDPLHRFPLGERPS
jgi:2'-5' RNA ligase